jgi:hypothetical protein
MRKCFGKRSNGSSCKAHVRAGSQYCFFHDNQTAKQRQIAQSKGGSRRKARLEPLCPSEDFDLSTPEGIVASVQFVFNRLVRGEIEPKAAYAMAYLSECARKLHEVMVVKKEIECLKAQANTERICSPLREQLDDHAGVFEELPIEENTPNA